MKTSGILIFDMPLNKKSEARQVQRELNKMGAKMIQQSVWKCFDLNLLIKIAISIKEAGGSARILEEKFIF